MESAIKKSWNKGKADGLKEGIKEGKKEIAKNLLKEGVDIKIISSSTGLSINDINKLNK